MGDYGWHPTVSEAVEKYYAVYQETTRPGGIYEGESFGNLVSAASPEQELEKIKSDFVDVMNQLISYEKGKEKKLIQQFIKKFGVNEELTKKLQECLDNDKYTEAFMYIHIFQNNQNERMAKIPLVISDWNNYINSFLNKSLMDLANEALTYIDTNMDISNLSPHEITDQLMTYMKNNYRGDPKYRINYEVFMESFHPDVLKAIQENNENFGRQNWDIPAGKLTIKSKKKGKIALDSNQKIVERFTASVLKGIFNGFSSEEYVVDIFGGFSTARATRTNKFFSNDLKQSVQTETDMYLIWNAELKPDTSFSKKVEGVIRGDGEDDKRIKEILSKAPEDDFVLHYSSKDSSIALASKNLPSTKIGKIKGEGSLDSRIETLKSMGSTQGFNSADINKIIFTIVNNGVGLISQGAGLDTAIQAITALCIGFMFEDFDDQVIRAYDNSSNNELHLYFLTGRFVPASYILEQMVKQIRSELSSDVIKVKITPASQLFTSVANSPEQRWKDVRNSTISATKMEINAMNQILKGLNI